MARPLTPEQQARIAELEAQEAADEARYGKHCKVSSGMRSEFLNDDWDEEAREAAFAQVAAAWGIEDGILRLPANHAAMTETVIAAYNRMQEIIGTLRTPWASKKSLPPEPQIEALLGAFHHRIWLAAGGRYHEFDEARQVAWRANQIGK